MGDAARELMAGRYDHTGRLMIAGRTLDLHPAAQATVATVLQYPSRAGHPWPATLPHSHYTRHPAAPQPYTRVHPDTVAELVVDPATDGLRWRHPVTYVRLRPDLHPADLTPTAPTTPTAPPPSPEQRRDHNIADGETQAQVS